MLRADLMFRNGRKRPVMSVKIMDVVGLEIKAEAVIDDVCRAVSDSDRDMLRRIDRWPIAPADKVRIAKEMLEGCGGDWNAIVEVALAWDKERKADIAEHFGDEDASIINVDGIE